MAYPEHPLIAHLRTAGEQTRTVATYLLSTNERDFFPLADALVTDATGHSLIDDRNTLDDRDRTREEYAAARARNAVRTALHRTLADLPRDLRTHVIEAIATGRATEEADALRLAAEAAGLALVDAVQASARTDATA
mgnify:CR=1 FL=1